MLTVKLTDEEMAALRALAAGRPMSDLVRAWIAGGQVVYTAVEEQGTLGLDTTGGHPVDRVDTSTAAEMDAGRRSSRIVREEDLPPLTGVSGALIDTHGSTDIADWTPKPQPLTSAQRVAAGLAAPDDDCASCGHDRQGYHLDGVCRMPTGPRARCGCPAFVDPAEPF